MDLYQSFKMAFKQLLSNKLRTMLTMLGIIIGVCSVTMLVSVANGMQQSINDEMSGLGSSLVTVNIMSNDASNKFTVEDSNRLKDINGVKSIAPVTNGNVLASFNGEKESVSAISTTESYQEVKNMEISKGRFILDIDVDYSSKVVVLGSEIANTLFGLNEPVGKTINLNGVPYKVVGVLNSQGENAMNTYDNSIVLPLTSGQRLVKNTSISSVYISSENDSKINYIVKKLEGELYSIFKDEDSYNVFNQQEIIESMESMQSTMGIVLGAIASISLVVGGIGIMNIMLVSVSERTKEIGIRKALGAKRKTILIQFLIESVVVSLLGGIIGAIIGIIGSNVIYSVMGIEASISWNVVILSLGFSMVVGLVFGILPANKASKLQPIQALRTE
ncbi:ABC transporter permease [Clostridium sp.]|uniref:ABC transporter permease n=1 Tax=Clostridium sp. TaxID=1506 RepID=UPI003F3C9754